jgi:lysophospholipase L1-like esterase
MRPEEASMRHVVSILALLALGSAVTGVAPPGTAEAASNRPQTYLALGDSLAFGFSPLVSPLVEDNFIGYPDTVAAALKLRLTNAACPGETSSHLVDLAGIDNNCGPWRANFPLHATYSTTQLAFADAFLKSHPKTMVVSIDIGANDVQALVNSCGGMTTPAQIKCIQDRLPGVLGALAANLDTIYGHIRNLDRYHHKLVAVTTYSTNYGDPLLTGVVAQINAVVADRTLAFDGIVADGFGAFAAVSAATGGDACAAGLLIAVSASPLTCDSHPSPAGRDLMARAIVKALRSD